MKFVAPKNRTPADKWFLEPIHRFINNSTASSIVLIACTVLAIILSNSPWSEEFHHLWQAKFSIGFDKFMISKDLHHWINDGLMAIFFFVVGLELKREIIAGQLQSPKNAMLPIIAAIGGMIFPALIYLAFNYDATTSSGWGIPMATDIAFVLGVVYLLGDKVPISLKVFLTALAIVDDLGAVLVIAIFYTSEIDFVSLATAGVFLSILIIGNIIGIRNRLFYGIIGIGGVWLAFLLSGVHATIAAVLAAMTIPANVKVDEKEYLHGLRTLLSAFEHENPNNKPTVTDNQLHILQNIRTFTKKALTPLQRLEHGLHPFVAFIVIPLFALSNAGFTFSSNIMDTIQNPVFIGTCLGLLVGKVIGVYGLVSLLLQFKIVSLPYGMNKRHLLGGGFLAAIGFTMSLFVAGLAFTNYQLVEQAKMGAICSSLIASIIGYFILRSAHK